MLSKKKMEIGMEVEALCNKCKGATVHVVVAIKSQDMVRVMCKACQSLHRFKAPESKTARKAGKLLKAKKAKLTPEARETKKWNKLLLAADREKAVAYSMSQGYAENDVIQHTKFGIGVVVKILDPSKISVVFEGGLKNMVQNHK
jgi:RNase P subunit RPR2